MHLCINISILFWKKDLVKFFFKEKVTLEALNINWILLGVIQKVRSLRRGGGMWGSH